MKDVCVVIPWRAQPERRWGYSKVVSYYRDTFPEFPVFAVDSNDQYFNLAAARNFGVNYARDNGFDAVIITDADTLPDTPNIPLALEQAVSAPGVVLPYTSYHSLGRDGTRAYRAGTPLREAPHFEVPSACSGIYITTPDTWTSHYGQDIRFRGWGYEDSAWECAHNTLIGPIRRIPGNVYSFHHPSQEKAGKQFVLNAALCHRYLQAQSDSTAMRSLCEETHVGQTAVNGKVVAIYG